MGRRAFALATGIFVAVLTAGLIASALFLRGWNTARTPYLVVAGLPVTGLRPGAEISYRGVTAGVVDSLRVDPDDPRRVLVRILVDPGIPVTGTSFATLKTEGVTGARVLDLDVGAPAPPLATSAARPGRIPLRPALLDEMDAGVRELLPQVRQLAANLSELTGAENRARVARILANTEAATARIDTVGREIEASLHRSLRGVPRLVEQGQTTMAHVDALAVELRRLTADLDGVARDASGLATSTQRELRDSTMPRLNTALDQIARTSASLGRLSRELEADPRALLRGRALLSPGPGERGHRWAR